MQKIGRPRRDKLFGDGRPVPLDREGKTRVMVLARVLMRRTEPGRAYGSVTAKAVQVLQVLLWAFHNSKSGRCFPSYATIAERAGCAVSTVGEAIRMLEAAGLIEWVNRLARIKVYVEGLGWRTRVIRTSNAYSFRDPAMAERSTPAPSRPRLCSRTETRSGTQNQDHLRADAPSRRGSDAAESALALALERFEKARQLGMRVPT